MRTNHFLELREVIIQAHLTDLTVAQDLRNIISLHRLDIDFVIITHLNRLHHHKYFIQTLSLEYHYVLQWRYHPVNNPLTFLN